MKNYKFCPICGNNLGEKVLEGRERPFCVKCGWVHYVNPLPVVSCLVLNGKKELLLIKRGIEPAIGEWALPGGFLELEETPEEAGQRELAEETGLRGIPGRHIGINTHISPVYGHLLMIGIEYIVEDFTLKVGDDAEDAAFYPVGGLPDIPFLSHRKLIISFLSHSG